LFLIVCTPSGERVLSITKVGIGVLSRSRCRVTVARLTGSAGSR
jgi:hypothetical protein